MEIDLRFVEIEAELSALNEYRQVLERQLRYLKDQKTVQMKADLRALDPTDKDYLSEVDLSYQERDYLIEYVYPKAFRGSFVVLVWAAYESAVTEVAEFLREVRGAELQLSDIRGANFVDRARKYFDHVLRVPLHEETSPPPPLTRLDDVRNAFAHAAGRLAAMKGPVREAVDQLCGHDDGLEEIMGDIVPSQSFLKECLEAVDASVRALLERARKAHDDR